MASIGKRTIVKELERRTKPAGISKNPAAKLALAASERSRPKLKATRLKKNVETFRSSERALKSARGDRQVDGIGRTGEVDAAGWVDRDGLHIIVAGASKV